MKLGLVLPHPCCGYSLRNVVLVFGVIEAVLAIVFMIQDAYLLGEYLPASMKKSDEDAEIYTPNEELKIYQMMTVIIFLNLFYWASSLWLGILLVIGTKRKEIRKCRQWLIWSSIFVVLFSVDVFYEVFSFRASILEILSPVIGTVLLSYMLWIVFEFLKELKGGSNIPFKANWDTTF